jgi:DNA modification methylase
MTQPIDNFINKIINDKWENVMPQIPDNSVDIIITSPPYNVDLGGGSKSGLFNNKKYDDYEDNMPHEEYLEWMDKIFEESYRVLKRGGRIVINIGDGKNGSIPTHADFIVRMKDKHKFIPMATIVWVKSQISNRFSWGSYCSPSQPSFPKPFEYIIVMAKETTKHEGDPKKITVTPKEFQTNSLALWTFPPETQMKKLYDHPAVFPITLPRRLIQQLTYEDDIVLDPFTGAGTTCTAAKQLNRKYIGIEMSKKYYDTSIKRLNEVPVLTKTKIKNSTSKNISEITMPDWMS